MIYPKNLNGALYNPINHIYMRVNGIQYFDLFFRIIGTDIVEGMGLLIKTANGSISEGWRKNGKIYGKF